MKDCARKLSTSLRVTKFLFYLCIEKKFFIPLLPGVTYMRRSAKIFIFNLRRDHKKIPMSVATMSQ